MSFGGGSVADAASLTLEFDAGQIAPSNMQFALTSEQIAANNAGSLQALFFDPSQAAVGWISCSIDVTADGNDAVLTVVAPAATGTMVSEPHAQTQSAAIPS